MFLYFTNQQKLCKQKNPPKLLRIKTGLGNGGREGEEEKHPAPMFLYFTNPQKLCKQKNPPNKKQPSCKKLHYASNKIENRKS